jgi:riboflavin kinase / FMN adenylyltransferase
VRVFRHLDEIPSSLGATVISIGNFDGVHCGHKSVLKEVARRARELEATAVAVTFDPHPVRILRPEAAPKLITPPLVKLELLKSTGLDAVLVIPFTAEFSRKTPKEFAQQVIVDRLNAKEVHEGSNFHFGHKAEGTVERLAEFGRELGFHVEIYREMHIRGDAVSSSRIRELLQEGNVSRARALLGRTFSIIGTPAKGRGYGSKYTVPTINLSHYNELVPANGVYITRTEVGGERFDSVTNVGVRPTFGDASFAIETHLLNFHPLTLNESTNVEIEFLKRLRAEVKFPNPEALRQQIQRDVKRAQRYFVLHRRLFAQNSAPASSHR